MEWVGILCYKTYFQAVLRYALACFKNYCLLCELRILKKLSKKQKHKITRHISNDF